MENFHRQRKGCLLPLGSTSLFGYVYSSFCHAGLVSWVKSTVGEMIHLCAVCAPKVWSGILCKGYEWSACKIALLVIGREEQFQGGLILFLFFCLVCLPLCFPGVFQGFSEHCPLTVVSFWKQAGAFPLSNQPLFPPVIPSKNQISLWLHFIWSILPSPVGNYLLFLWEHLFRSCKSCQAESRPSHPPVCRVVSPHECVCLHSN